MNKELLDFVIWKEDNVKDSEVKTSSDLGDDSNIHVSNENDLDKEPKCEMICSFIKKKICNIIMVISIMAFLIVMLVYMPLTNIWFYLGAMCLFGYAFWLDNHLKKARFLDRSNNILNLSEKKLKYALNQINVRNIEQIDILKNECQIMINKKISAKNIRDFLSSIGIGGIITLFVQFFVSDHIEIKVPNDTIVEIIMVVISLCYLFYMILSLQRDRYSKYETLFNELEAIQIDMMATGTEDK